MTCFFITMQFGLLASAQNKTEGAKNQFTKCQDENGVWHYGSSNLHKCPQSSGLTVLNDRGVRLDKVDPVKTQEQLEAEKQVKEKEEQEKEEQKQLEMQRERILTIYQTEADIKVARERALKSIDVKIKQHRNYIEALKNQEKILNNKISSTSNKAIQRNSEAEIEKIKPKQEYSKSRISELQAEKIEVNKYYDKDLEIFRKYN